jgi:hypothetical protein
MPTFRRNAEIFPPFYFVDENHFMLLEPVNDSLQFLKGNIRPEGKQLRSYPRHGINATPFAVQDERE